MVCRQLGDCHGLADNAIPDRLSARTTTSAADGRPRAAGPRTAGHGVRVALASRFTAGSLELVSTRLSGDALPRVAEVRDDLQFAAEGVDVIG